MIRYFKDISFIKKMTIIFTLCMVMGVSMVIIQQVSTANALVETEKIRNLSLLTEQIALNFSKNQTSIENEIYDRASAFDIPRLVNAYPKQTTAAKIQDMLNQMITTMTSYDYIMVETLNHQRISNNPITNYEKSRANIVYEDCQIILDGHTETTYGECHWIRMESGEVYILRDIYQVSPLMYVGTMVIHMRSDFFRLSSAYKDTGFIFFDVNNQMIVHVGDVINNAVLSDVCKDVERNQIREKSIWNDEEYFTAQKTDGEWSAVGISSMNEYREAQGKILRDGLAFGLLAIALGTSGLVLLNSSLRCKLRQLSFAMDKIADGDFGYQAPITDNDDISQLMVTFNYMSHHIKDLLNQLVEKERYKHDAEFQILEYKLRSLETQIRPHFIYNALETISAMAKIKGDTEIVDIVQRISRYFRNISVNSTHQFITTQQEFDYLEDYTEIYRYIHGDQLKTIFRAGDMSRNAMIPTMIVQPVVENALQHGMRGKSQISELRVHAYVESQNLIITIKDSGNGLTEEQIDALKNGRGLNSTGGSGIGLLNVQQRLSLIYGEAASLNIENRRNGGVKVTIKIPFAYSTPDLSDDLDVLDELDALDD